MAVVKQAPPELVRILKDAQVADGRRWEAIATAANVPWPTIQGWLRNVPNPPLIGVMAVAKELKIPWDDLARAILPDETPLATGEETLRELEDHQRDHRKPAGSSETDSASDDPTPEDGP